MRRLVRGPRPRGLTGSPAKHSLETQMVYRADKRGRPGTPSAISADCLPDQQDRLKGLLAKRSARKFTESSWEVKMTVACSPR
ncbi:hypothetical protein FrEUN1fDRAFT_4020 [Parafrankia sp. EUN1f]|nr:hypothetical protein FrEUN1fDRAFT_4020 [Parafrankia sp. EUN1f]